MLHPPKAVSSEGRQHRLLAECYGGEDEINIILIKTMLQVMGFIAVMVNCGLIGLSGPVHRIFPNITGAQTVILDMIIQGVFFNWYPPPKSTKKLI